ncbi:hypothetical protein RM697_07980 [Ichthyenterobacterium sp. W332]|uniref:Prophage protein n=1 Tax=Microcosmobacter mediterraneus TaxID=3075607 RepID=A0ABU2YMS6_9FLAO|nr:hypothetical protein [Ichthyenterobacterium sp. W332]MDT0558580.1 hypothetical protein [Ichthyenterobacterium sp. W332]
MKNTTSNAPWTSKLKCSIFGHNYEVTKKVTKHVKEYTCKCCKHQLTTNGNGRLTELTPTYRDINSILEKIYNRRMMHLQKKSFTSSIYTLKNTA